MKRENIPTTISYPIKCSYDEQRFQGDEMPFYGFALRPRTMTNSRHIYPQELHPKGSREWEGIPLHAWYNYITKGEPIFGKIEFSDRGKSG